MRHRNGYVARLTLLFVVVATGWPACAPLAMELDARLGSGPANKSVETRTLDAAGGRWEYALPAISEQDEGRPIPAVIILHGSGERGADQLLRNGWIAAGRAHGFLPVAPTALPMNPAFPPRYAINPTQWNAGQPYLTAERRAIDDVAFFDALFEQLIRVHGVDPGGFFLVGHSGGASMAFRIATERTERIRAMAVVAGPLWLSAPRPAVAVPTLYMNGLQDPLHPIDGGRQDLPWFDRVTPPVAETLAEWARALGCVTEARRLGDPDLSRVLGLPDEMLPGVDDPGVMDRDRIEAWSYAPQSGVGDPPLIALFLAGHGHRWPGGSTPALPEILIGPDQPPVNATEVICRYFNRCCRASDEQD